MTQTVPRYGKASQQRIAPYIAISRRRLFNTAPSASSSQDSFKPSRNHEALAFTSKVLSHMHAFWMVWAAFLFASMGVCIKAAAPYFSPGEMVFYRGLIGMLLMFLWARRQGVSLTTKYPGMHAWRSLIGVL